MELGLTELSEQLESHIERSLRHLSALFPDKGAAIGTQHFSELDDDAELVDDFVRQVPSDAAGRITLAQLRAALHDLEVSDVDRELSATLEGLLLHSKLAEGSDHTFSRKDLERAVGELPRVQGERMCWVRSLGLEGELARRLPRGTLFDGLRGLRGLGEAEAEAYVGEICRQLASDVLPRLLRDGLRRLRAQDAEIASKDGVAAAKTTSATAVAVAGGAVESVEAHMNSKFVMDGAYVGRFATLDDFFRGPEALIGVPNPKAYEGAELEHTRRGNARRRFRTSNYNLETTPAVEWEFVVCPREGVLYVHTPVEPRLWRDASWKGEHGREAVTLEELLNRDEVRRVVLRAGLQKVEVICLRLYTGPMFVLYNASLRGFPAWDVACLKDDHGVANKFETTIFLIASGITKLAKITDIPVNRRLYRGLGGMILPEQFWRNFAESQLTVQVRPAAAGQRDARSPPEHLEASKPTPTESTLVLRSEADPPTPQHTALLRLQKLLADRVVWLRSMATGSEASPDEANALLVAFLDLGGAAADAQRVRLVAEPDADLALGVVRLVVALQCSKYDLTAERREGLVSALLRLCGNEAVVKIVDEADKPRDFKGGVEFGLMSTTEDKKTAIAYSGVTKKRGTVLEIEAGRIDIGASIQFISQYPGEKEFLMQPLSCLEVKGAPFIEQNEFGEVVVIPMRVNVNLKGITIEDLLNRRKFLQIAMAKNLREDMQYSLEAEAQQCQAVLEHRGKMRIDTLKGSDKEVQVDEVESSVCFDSADYTIAGAPFLLVTKGKFYFELELAEEAVGSTVVFAGVAGSNFRGDRDRFVGDGKASWSLFGTGRAACRGNFVDGVEGCIFNDGWCKKGCVLSLALDLQRGSMQASIDGGEWREVFALGVLPSLEVGAGLFPALGGRYQAKVLYRFGGHHKPLRFPPPSPEFLPVAEAARVQGASATALASSAPSASASVAGLAPSSSRFFFWGQVGTWQAAKLDSLGVSVAALLGQFDEVLRRLEAMDGQELNDDQTYKGLLNEMLDLKVGLSKKQHTILQLW